MDKSTPSKVCKGCGATKALADFRTDRRARDGRGTRCKACCAEEYRRYAQTGAGRASQRARSKRYAERHPDRMAERQRAWHEKHPGYSAETNRRWREANPDAAARYYVENRERINALGRLWRERNADRRAAANREWSATNRERRSEATRKWQKNNPDKAREIAQRRRARKRAASVGPVDLEALWIESRGLCGICTQPLDAAIRYPDPSSPSLDHIVPLAKGGTHEQANLQWAHLVCNHRKGAKSPDFPSQPKQE